MKRFNITVNGKTYDVQVDEIGGNTSVAVPAPAVAPAPAATPAPAAAPAPVATPAPAPAPAPVASSGVTVSAPMPGNILDVKVAVGDTVTEGQVLVILEAMKMENEIVAPESGTVTAVHIQKGDTVESGTALVSL